MASTAALIGNVGSRARSAGTVTICHGKSNNPQHLRHCRYQRCERAYLATFQVRTKSTKTTGADIPYLHSGKIAAFITKARPGIGSISLLCGHTGFFFATLSFANTDMLSLRCLAVSSISLVMAFNYYRPQPLWVPLRWNSLLLAINGAMIAGLLIERSRADNMPQEMEDLYCKGRFESRGFSRVEFMRLFDHGRQRTFSDVILLREGEEFNHLCFLIDGTLRVACSKTDKTLAMLKPPHFVGEMAFLSVLDNMTVVNGECPENPESASTLKASANVFAHGQIRVWQWNCNKLAETLRDDRELRNAFAAYINHDLRTKLLLANSKQS